MTRTLSTELVTAPLCIWQVHHLNSSLHVDELSCQACRLLLLTSSAAHSLIDSGTSFIRVYGRTSHLKMNVATGLDSVLCGLISILFVDIPWYMGELHMLVLCRKEDIACKWPFRKYQWGISGVGASKCGPQQKYFEVQRGRVKRFHCRSESQRKYYGFAQGPVNICEWLQITRPP